MTREQDPKSSITMISKVIPTDVEFPPYKEDIVDIVVPHSNPCIATNGRSGNYCNLPRGVNVYFLFVALSLSTLGVRFADKWYKFSVINKLAVLYSYSPPPRHHHQNKCLLKELEGCCSGGKGLI